VDDLLGAAKRVMSPISAAIVNASTQPIPGTVKTNGTYGWSARETAGPAVEREAHRIAFALTNQWPDVSGGVAAWRLAGRRDRPGPATTTYDRGRAALSPRHW
jgi:hypothetical protein